MRRFLTVVGLAVACALPGAAAAAPVLKGASSAATPAEASSITLSRPSAVSSGDVLVAVVDARLYASGVITAPPGWSLVRRDSTALSALTQAIYIRTATSSEPSSYTWGLSSRVSAAAAILAYAGVDRGAPVAAVSGGTATRGSVVTAPSVTPPVADTTLVAFWATNGQTPITVPSDVSERTTAISSGSSLNVSLKGAEGGLVAAGPSGDRAARAEWGYVVAVGQLLALRPAGGATAPQPAVTAPVNTVPPAVTGTPVSGQTVRAAAGSWTGSEPISYAYQWQRNVGNGWTPIAGATQASYTLGAADIGYAVRVAVTASNAAGSTVAASTSTVPVAAPSAPSPSLMASLESGTLTEFHQISGAVDVTTTRSYDGSRSAHAATPANRTGSPLFARGIFEVNWQDGTDIWYGMAVYLPQGFYAAQQGQVDILRWDNWTIDPTTTDRSGIVIYGSDKRARLVRQRLGVEQVELVGPFTIAEGTWHRLEVHQRLSAQDGAALSEVYLNGTLIGRSSKKNAYGRPVTRIRYGIVARNDGAQRKALELWFDRAAAASQRVGL